MYNLRRAANISGGDVGSDLELSRELKVALWLAVVGYICVWRYYDDGIAKRNIVDEIEVLTTNIL